VGGPASAQRGCGLAGAAQSVRTADALSADADPQLFLRIDRNKSIKMSGKLAVGGARDSQFFSEHPYAIGRIVQSSLR